MGHLVGLCIVVVDGDTIPTRDTAIWWSDTGKAISTTGTRARCTTTQGFRHPLHDVKEWIRTMTTVSPEKSQTHTVIGKDELIHQIASRAGLSLKETTKVIDAFTEVVRDDITEGHEVRLMGFGTWSLREVASRQVKSIRGGQQITIPARKRVGFSVGAVLSQAAKDESRTAHRHMETLHRSSRTEKK